MNHVIVYVQPFLLEQEIAVYKEGQCVKTQKCTMENIDSLCYSLCKEFNIHQIDLAGPPSYIEKVKEDILLKTDFDSYDINVSLY